MTSLLSPDGAYGLYADVALIAERDLSFSPMSTRSLRINGQSRGCRANGLPADSAAYSHQRLPPLPCLHVPARILLVHRRHGDKVQGFLVKPPNFDANKKYPVKFLIHGGPQGAWGDDWSYRWNPELFAANGYVVIMINFHGSTGYGQKFIDAINGDWGGAPYEDLMKGLDYAEKTLSVHRQRPRVRAGRQLRRLHGQLDPRPHQPLQVHRDARRHVQRRLRLGHDRRTLVQRVGVQRHALRRTAPDVRQMVAAPCTPRTSRRRRWSSTASSTTASTSAKASSSSPRCRRQGVPSKMLYFPDEGHWVLKPQNSQLWYKTVNDWVDQWTKK